MTDAVTDIIHNIDRRLAELRAEADRLRSARSALSGGSQRRSGSPRSGPRGGGYGKRADQALDAVRGTPGITVPEIAEALGIMPNYLYRVMPKLVADGRVHREGKGFHPVVPG
jgi:hypothetical protein